MVGLNELSMEGIKLLLILAIVVIGVTITLIGYFMSKRDNAITQATDNLIKAVEQLQIIVNGLQLQYQIRQPIIDERLKAHSEVQSNHEGRIKTLEIEHNMNHCKYQEK